MYELVNQVEEYPKFLSGCAHSEILSSSCNQLTASITMKLGFLKQSFTTRNTLIPGHSIQMQLVEGPFRHLEGIWVFEPTENGCLVRLDMEFEFSNQLFNRVMGEPFYRMINSLVDTFVRRAKDCYERQ